MLRIRLSNLAKNAKIDPSHSRGVSAERGENLNTGGVKVEMKEEEVIFGGKRKETA